MRDFPIKRQFYGQLWHKTKDLPFAKSKIIMIMRFRRLYPMKYIDYADHIIQKHDIMDKKQQKPGK